MDNHSTEFVFELVNGLQDTREYNRVFTADPMIAKSNDLFNAVVDGIEDKQLRNEVSDANAANVSHHTDAAILYGMRIAFQLMRVANNPEVLSQYTLDRFHGSEVVS